MTTGGQSAGAQLEMPGMPRRLFPATPSKLAAFSDCPRRYRFAYVDRPTPAKGPAWAQNTVGAAVHAARVVHGQHRASTDDHASSAHAVLPVGSVRAHPPSEQVRRLPLRKATLADEVLGGSRMAELAAVIASTHHPFYYKASSAPPGDCLEDLPDPANGRLLAAHWLGVLRMFDLCVPYLLLARPGHSRVVA